MDNRFSVQELHYNNLLKEMKLKKIYEQVTDSCFTKIKRANEQISRDYTEFIVPLTVMGSKDYNFTECICHIMFTLRKSGFYVRFVYPNKLYIFWPNYEKKKQEINKIKFLKFENDKTHRLIKKDGTLRPKAKSTHATLQENPYSETELLSITQNKALTLPN